MKTLFQVPTSSQNVHYTQVVALSGTLYQLELRYNLRMARWILSINDLNGTALLSGIPMLALRSLIGQYTTLELPPGLLFCGNLSNPTQEPTLTSFLQDSGFFYVETS